MSLPFTYQLKRFLLWRLHRAPKSFVRILRKSMEDLESKLANFGKAAPHNLRQSLRPICSRLTATSNIQSSMALLIPADENVDPNKLVQSPGGRSQSRFFQNANDFLPSDDKSSSTSHESSSTSLSGSAPLSPLISIFPFKCSACSVCADPQKGLQSSPWHSSCSLPFLLPPLFLPPAVQDFANEGTENDKSEDLKDVFEYGVVYSDDNNPRNPEMSQPSSVVDECTPNNLVLSSIKISNDVRRNMKCPSESYYGDNSSENLSQLDENGNFLAVDLSWLDDDNDVFERKMLENTVGKHIEVFSKTENLWRTGLVISKLSERQHVNIYIDGEEKDVNLGSLLWRVSKV